MYRDTSWNNIIVHQPVEVVKETRSLSISTFIVTQRQPVDWINLNLLPLDTYQESFRDTFFTSAGRWINNRICC